MAIFLLTAVGLFMIKDKFKHKKAVEVYVYSVLALNLVYYAVRLINIYN